MSATRSGPGLLDQLAEQAAAARERRDPPPRLVVDAERLEVLELGARLVEHADRRVAGARQLARGGERAREHDLSVEFAHHASGDAQDFSRCVVHVRLGPGGRHATGGTVARRRPSGERRLPRPALVIGRSPVAEEYRARARERGQTDARQRLHRLEWIGAAKPSLALPSPPIPPPRARRASRHPRGGRQRSRTARSDTTEAATLPAVPTLGQLAMLIMQVGRAGAAGMLTPCGVCGV